jgi:hypothetical protein
MIVLGVSVLGNLNNDDFDQKNLGLSMWRIVASAGILSMTMGIVNFIAVCALTGNKKKENC